MLLAIIGAITVIAATIENLSTITRFVTGLFKKEIEVESKPDVISEDGKLRIDGATISYKIMGKNKLLIVVKVDARDNTLAIRSEYAWINANYPNFTRMTQLLVVPLEGKYQPLMSVGEVDKESKHHSYLSNSSLFLFRYDDFFLHG